MSGLSVGKSRISVTSVPCVATELKFCPRRLKPHWQTKYSLSKGLENVRSARSSISSFRVGSFTFRTVGAYDSNVMQSGWPKPALSSFGEGANMAKMAVKLRDY